MRISLIVVLLLPLNTSIRAASAVEARVAVAKPSSLTPQLQKRQGALAPTSWSKATVPERFRDWYIFRDGGRVRETVRAAYVKLLAGFDRLIPPNRKWKKIHKTWLYKPDLRQHYVLPRVLRIPVIIQDGPIRYKNEFNAYIQKTDKELGLDSVAKKQVPSLEEKEGDGASEQTEARSSTRLGMEPGRRSARNRRRTRLARETSFSHFERPWEDAAAPIGTTVPEIHPEEAVVPEETELPQSTTPNERESDVDKSDVEGVNYKAPLVDELVSNLGAKVNRYEELRKFEAEQLRKAAYRYFGHPEHPASIWKGEVQEGHGLPPIRTKPQQSQEATPDPSPRGVIENWTGGADASDQETPISISPTHAHMPEVEMPHPSYYHVGRPVSSPGSPRTPQVETTVQRPSANLSPVRTPKASSGTSTPGSFRFPPDYVDLVHKVRQLGMGHLQRTPLDEPLAPLQRFDPDESREHMDWDIRRSPFEATHTVPEPTHFREPRSADHEDDTATVHQPQMPFSQAQAHIGDSGHSEYAPGSGRQGVAAFGENQPSTGRDIDLLSTPRGKQGIYFTQPSFSTSLETGESVPDGDDDVLTSLEEPVRKRKRPGAIDIYTPFRFPSGNTDPENVDTPGFKSSTFTRKD